MYTRRQFDRAAAFFDKQPTGQYDNEAAHALRHYFELLEALRLFVRDNSTHTEVERMHAARAAIAKATGETK